MKRFVRAAASIGLVIAIALAPAAASEPPPAGIPLVVQVLEDGQALRGLTPADFEIREQGRPVTIAALREIDLAAAVSAGAVPDAARRQILLLFDLMGPGSIDEAVAAARQLVLDGLHPADLAGVVVHQGSEGPRMVLAPTSDRVRIIEALATLGAAGGSGPSTGIGAPGPTVNADYLVAARNRDSEPEQGIVQQEQSRILRLIRTLSALALPQRGVPGPVQVVLFSEGFDSSVILGHGGTRSFDRASDSAASEAAVSGEIWRVTGSARYGGGVVETALFDMLAEYRRIGAPIQAMQVGESGSGRAARGGAQGQEGLRIMSQKTGGGLFRSPADLMRAMELPEVSYLLTIEPRSARAEGRYRRLEVILKNAPDRVSLVYRPGYYEPGR